MDTCFGWNVEAISYSWFLTTANRIDDFILNSVNIFFSRKMKNEFKPNNKMQNEMAEWMYGINKWKMLFSWRRLGDVSHTHSHSHTIHIWIVWLRVEQTNLPRIVDMPCRRRWSWFIGFGVVIGSLGRSRTTSIATIWVRWTGTHDQRIGA